uniref:DNA-directed RNA polymerase subunit beta' n=1 Tax=Koliella corcontica TaxID=155904 RepID=A0A097KMW2_9CHLO|nr:beta' subunit of RNA polymerase [Koliella corcontica]AIT94519.1 beta' subunit of RNA polymerase [Koliella corcontica]
MNFIRKKYTLKINEAESMRIGLASPERIKSWAEKILPNGRIIGQVTSSQTVNYKNLKPEKGGLFCERIFGPINDFLCACGKKRPKIKQKYCLDCDVEYTLSRVRRHRLGFIQLLAPVTHVWYLKGIPSYFTILLNLPRKKVEAIAYCTESINIYDYKQNITEEKKDFKNLIPINKTSFELTSSLKPKIISTDYFLEFIKDNENQIFINNNLSVFCQDKSWEITEDWNFFIDYMRPSPTYNDIFIENGKCNKIIKALSINSNQYIESKIINKFLIGGEAIRNLILSINLYLIEQQLRLEIFELNEKIFFFENMNFLLLWESRKLRKLQLQRSKIIRRLKLVRHFRRTKAKPEWMLLSVLPVLPPDLRPIVQLDGDQLAVSDLNKLYQKVLFRNNRMKRHKFNSFYNKTDEIKYSQRLLQEAVDSLIENGKGGSEPICSSNDRPLKSLSDMLKGKKGRFRQNLLGKRVDYSGRSVIIVGPELKIYECGLPKEMAIELFQPFLIRKLINKKIARTIVGAKRLIQTENFIIWDVLKNIMQSHLVLLNRAPTLHRLGIQAFQPKLIDGRAIILHPLVCNAFNADFDGDQMAVHVPLSFQARAEAWKLMLSRNNILSPATGQPIIMPSQDMILGWYYLTAAKNKIVKNKKNYFSNLDQVLVSYHKNEISLHDFIWVKWPYSIESNFEKEKPIELRLNIQGNLFMFYKTFHKVLINNSFFNEQFIRTTSGRILLNKLIT